MARFRGSVQGNRSEASRLGSKANGLRVSANGWELGVDVHMGVDSEGRDVATIYLTSGSNGRGSDVLIGKFSEADYDRLSDVSRIWEEAMREVRERLSTGESEQEKQERLDRERAEKLAQSERRNRARAQMGGA